LPVAVVEAASAVEVALTEAKDDAEELELDVSEATTATAALAKAVVDADVVEEAAVEEASVEEAAVEEASVEEAAVEDAAAETAELAALALLEPWLSTRPARISSSVPTVTLLSSEPPESPQTLMDEAPLLPTDGMNSLKREVFSARVKAIGMCIDI
jgi:hypothetical protein